MSFVIDIAGRRDLVLDAIVKVLKLFEEKENLFADFPIGTTIQDGGKRKRSGDGLPLLFIFIFIFLYQQFIIRRSVVDHGSYFCNYVQRKHANME